MIIGVAVKTGDLCIALPKPNRHSDCIKQILQLGVDITEWGKAENQGFYDEQGIFLSRAEAAKHAYECGQLPHEHGFSSECYW
jgi:hypothetical protein